jgi:hypothetical protein
MNIAETWRWTGRIGLGILFLILLTSCAAVFDENEYSRMVDIRVELQEARCTSPQDATIMSQRVKSHVDWLAIYSQHLPDNKNTVSMIAAMRKSTDEFADRLGREPASSAYCRLKVTMLQDQIDIILKTTARRPR